jgi:all-trans-retinol 13,14-reductase
VSRRVAIIGAGYGGLSTAIVLARLGFEVTLVEGARQPGGCLRSYQRESIDCPVGVHYFGAAAPGELLGDFLGLLEVRDALKLRRLGGSGVIDRFVFDDETFDLPDSPSKLELALRTRFSDAPEAVDFVMRVCRDAMAMLRTDTLNSARPLLPMTKNAVEVLADMRLPGRLMDLLALQGFLLGTKLSTCPAGFLMVATASLLMSAWELGCTGGEMANALAARAVACGASLIVDDPVAKILVEGDGASGVVLASGARLDADVVVSGIHPKAMLTLLPDTALPDSYRQGVLRLDETTGTLCAVALLDERQYPARDFNLFRVRGEPRKNLQGSFGQLRTSGLPGYSRLTVLVESAYDDWSTWHQTETGRRGPAYRAEKSKRAHAAIDDLAEAIGPIQGLQIVDTWTPLTMRDWTGAPRGSTYGVRHSTSDGLDYLVLSRPPLARLYMVGQNSIAPGLLGVSMGVLRVVSMIAGREAVAGLFAKHRTRADVPS